MNGSVGSPRYTTRTIGTTFETPDLRLNTTATWKRTCASKTVITTVKALATTLNGDKPGRVIFYYEPVTQQVVAHMKGDTKVALYGDLPDILGFMRGDAVTVLTSSSRSRIVRAYSIVDLRRGFESLYVYSSIVEPRIVGDKIAPLLRIVPITGSHGEMVTARFDHVQYIPVLSREFGCVETEIRDDTGRPVPFERGKVTVTLHFRRCSSGLFR